MSGKIVEVKNQETAGYLTAVLERVVPSIRCEVVENGCGGWDVIIEMKNGRPVFSKALQNRIQTVIDTVGWTLYEAKKFRERF